MSHVAHCWQNSARTTVATLKSIYSLFFFTTCRKEKNQKVWPRPFRNSHHGLLLAGRLTESSSSFCLRIARYIRSADRMSRLHACDWPCVFFVRTGSAWSRLWVLWAEHVGLALFPCPSNASRNSTRTGVASLSRPLHRGRHPASPFLQFRRTHSACSPSATDNSALSFSKPAKHPTSSHKQNPTKLQLTSHVHNTQTLCSSFRSALAQWPVP